ncbi:5,6-dimethylbenzimidazole synthase [Vibrio sp. CAIM 722]|uniref:5,6-dimethylbenzimidazole synthase n=1 Tax=Vibrio eleionomae TaxID=2653505 RepID=A0A7X4LM00_9VIBR|nr:5,6-dimethylbenzimidazole synthase [Vibrio eleionomae]MZI94412.1 5,6-dimethylbenzimidazole synthase [Vibrio eleionomae]
MNNRQFSSQEQQTLRDLILLRRDIRGNNFLPDAISDQQINELITAAALGPSVGYSQPWEFVVIKDNDIKQQVHQSFATETKIAADKFSTEKQALYHQLKLEGILEAPINIAVFYKKPNEPILGQNSMAEAGEYSVVCAIQNMWLMARSMNLGLGWVSIINPETVKTIVNAPQNRKLVAYLCLGYVKEFHSVPELETLKWESRKPIESFTFSQSYPTD